MLRLSVFLLLLANALFFAWTQGAMDHLIDLRSTGDRELERQANQVRPDDLTVLSASAPGARIEPPRSECLEAGPFGPADIALVEKAASALVPNVPWSRRQAEFPGVWVVLMGPYANRELLEKKINELRQARVEFEEITDLPAFKFSLALGGRYPSAQAATTALSALGEQGIKSATVAAIKPPLTQWFLRLENTDAAQAKQLRALQGPPWGAGWVACT